MSYWAVKCVTVVCIILVSLLVNGSAADPVWYQGCYSEQESSLVLTYTIIDSSNELTAAICCNQCRQRGYQYAGILNGTQCSCGYSFYSTLTPLDEELCHARCFADTVQPCGGDKAFSLYSVLGPYIVDVSVEVPRYTVQQNDHIVVEISVQLASPGDTDLGYDATNVSLIYFTWDVSGSITSKQSSIEDTTISSNILHTFQDVGTYTIGVTVHHTISTTFERYVNITVIAPIPAGLEIGHVPGSRSIPSCIPEHSAIPDNTPTVSGFVDTAIHLQASVVFGVNLTFNWAISDDDRVITSSPYMDDSQCTGMGCFKDLQMHTFNTTGLFTISVNVSNHLGSVAETLCIVVVDKGHSNITITMESPSYYVKVFDTSVRFAVSIVTAHRQDSTMFINFHDGISHEYSLHDGNQTDSMTQWYEPNYIHITSSYGIGCTLNLQFEHRYFEPGIYNTTVEVTSIHDHPEFASLPQYIIAQEAIASYPTININPWVVANQDINVTVTLTVPAEIILYDWAVNGIGINISESVQHTENTFHYNFPEAGLYSLSVNVSNYVSFLTAYVEVTALEMIVDLQLDVGGSEVITTGDTVSVLALVTAGSDIQFIWDFSDGSDDVTISDEDPPSADYVAAQRSNHTYTMRGVYDLVVTVQNLISSYEVYLEDQYIVQDAVEGLLLSGGHPTILGNRTEIYAHLYEGSDISFDIDVGNGRIQADVVGNPDSSWTIYYTFNATGSFRVTMYAYNNVSMESDTVSVLVQEDIESVTVELYTEAVIGVEVPVTALIDDVISARTDLIYNWNIDGISLLTQIPVIGYTFTNNTHLKVTVNNFVARQIAEIDVSAVTTSNMYLTHAVSIEVERNVTFTLKNSQSSTLDVSIDYGNGVTHNISSGLTGEDYSWVYVYPITGIFEVTTNVTHGGVVNTFTSIISIQEVITGLELMGSSAVKFYRPFKVLHWFASTINGTAVIYKWTITPLYVDTDAYVSGVNSISWTSVHARKSHLFRTPGVYNVSLTVSNALSSVSTSMVTILQDPIKHLDVSIATVLHEDPSVFVITIKGGKHFDVDMSFGDGTTFSFSTETEKNITEFSDFSGQLPKYTYHVVKQYINIGHYDCVVNISNDVSFETKSLAAIVDEPISGLLFTSVLPPVMSLYDELTMTAEVATGTDVVFNWNFNDNSVVQTHGHSSTARHKFSSTGTFNVSVSVQNIMYDEPIMLQYPYSIIIQEPITYADVTPMNTNHAELSNDLNATTQVIDFQVFADGFPVVFEINYGDNSATEIIVGEIRTYLGVVVTGHHTYSSEGEYTVCVTAINLLGNVSVCMMELFKVQVAPHGLSTDNTQYITRFGNTTDFQLFLEGGTDVHFDWIMGDQTVYVDAGTSVSHHYLTDSDYVVTITAYNDVGTISTQVYASILSGVQGVEVEVDKDLWSTGSDVTFTAVTLTDATRWFIWDMGDGSSTSQTVINEKVYTYTGSGIFYVSVTAANALSSVTSPPVEIHIESAVDDLDIWIHNNPTLIGSATKFYPDLFAGSDLTFEWDFGDNQSLSTNEYSVEHKYTSTGEYLVTLYAHNRVSSATIQSTVFILVEMCKPPLLIIHNPYSKWLRCKDIHIEVDATIDCEVTAQTNYRWSILQDNQEITLNNEAILYQRILFIPSKTLDYGTYTMSLKVEMNSTIVYSIKETIVEVVPTPLVAIIAGGTSRVVGSDTIVQLDATSSFDPDFPIEGGLSFNWTCSLLTSPTVSCFKEELLANMSSPLDTNDSSISFSTSLLLQDPLVSLVFWLRVSKNGRDDAYTSQVLEVVPGKPLNVMMSCPLCWKDVNANNELTFNAECVDCWDDVTYTWTMFVVLDGSGTNSLPASHRCVTADGRDYVQLIIYPNITDESTSMSNAIDGNAVYDDGSDYSGPYSNIIYDGDVDNTGNPNSEVTPQPFGGSGGIIDAEEQSEEPRGDSNSNIGGGVVEEEEEDGRGTGNGDTGNNDESGDEGTGEGDGDDNNGDQVRDENIVVVYEEHIASKAVQAKRLLVSETSTGLHGQSLVINDGVLDEDRTYVVVVTMSSSDGRGAHKVEREGLANIYFTVNKGPMWGKCTLLPESGVEMDTVFTISCQEWVDDQQPLMYQISYSIGSAGSEELLYYGMKSSVSFQLPAGDPNNNNTEGLHISIVDNFGGKTKVCSLEVTVEPKPLSNSPESLLHSYVAGPGSTLYIYMQNGDEQSVQLYVRMVSSMINRLQPLNPNSLNYTQNLNTRQEIRLALLYAIDYLTVRDSNDVLQYSMILITITDSPSELSVNAMMLAAELVERMVNVVVLDDSISKVTSQSVIGCIAMVTSNLLEASDGSYTVVPPGKKKFIITKIVGSNEDLLKAHQTLQAIDEAALEIETDNLDIYSGCHSQVSSVAVTKGRTSFQFPSNMNEVLADLGDNMINNCYSLQLMSFRGNPYTWDETSAKVASDVSSFELLTCSGSNLAIENLQYGITIHLPRTPQLSENLGNFTFDKSFLNYHEFNVTSENMEQSFHLLIELIPIIQRGFPIKLLMRYGEPPTPYDFILERLYDEDANLMTLFFKAGYFNSTGTYYLGLMDGEFGEYRYRPDSVTVRHYTLKLWWGECLYWSKESENWLNDGCDTMESSTFDVTHCRCSHLTNFAGGFSQTEQELSFADIDQFNSVEVNPVVYSFVVFVVGIYLILLIVCYLGDVHDDKKRGVVYLQDNQQSDQQCYEITVETGFRSGAGTTAKVSLVLHGELGHSETRELTDEKRPLFERNSRDKFIVSVPETLGTIYKLQVWHNNAGSSPSWFLSRISVRDLINGQKWYFICEKWFAVEEDDGKVERDIYPQDYGVGFQKVFYAKGSQYFADYHLWSSVFTKPSHSRFTRVQRLTCCLAILLTFMCIIGTWYRFNDRPEWSTHLGIIDVSIESLVVGIVTALMALPVNGPIVMLFRRSKPKKPCQETERMYSTKKRTSHISSNDTMETLLTGEPYYPSVVEETAWTWQRLQSWAQGKWKYRHRFQSMVNSSKESLHIDPAIISDVHSTQEQTHIATPILSQYDSASCSSGFGDLNSEDRNRLVADNKLSGTDTNSVVSTVYDKHHSLDHKKFKKIYVPHWCRYIAWFLVSQVIFWAAFFVIFFGIRFCKSKSVMWIQSLYFSILQCVFVTQPLVILTVTLIRSFQYRNDIRVFDHADDNTELLEPGDLPKSRLDYYADEDDDDDLSKGIAARQRSRYLRFARPPQKKELQKAKERMMKEKTMYSILKGCLFYCILFTCVMLMCYGKFHNHHILLNNAVKNTFVRTPHAFTSIQSIPDFWAWCENDLMDGLYWDSWYSGGHQENRSIMGGSHILLGKVSVRQLRVSDDSCSILPGMNGIVNDCRGTFSDSSNSKMPYGPNETWMYQDTSHIVRYCKWGRFGYYDGEGFVTNLNSTRMAAAEQLSQLKEDNWIDVHTRLVIVEFTLYNPPTNLFTSVALVLELPGTGGIYPLPMISSIMLYRYETFFDYFIMVLELMFLALVVYSAKCEVGMAIKEKKDHFLRIWAYIEIIFILSSLTFFACYVYRCVYVNQISERLQATYHEEFVDMSFLALWDQVLRDISGVITFLVLIKLFYVLRFIGMVAKFGNIISVAIKQLLILTIWYTVIVAIYSGVGVIVFGTVSLAFSHFGYAVQTMTSTIRGAYDYSELKKVYPIAVPVFYISYFLTLLILLLGMAKTLLNRSYKLSKEQATETVSIKEFVCFTWEKFLLCTGIHKLSPSHDDDMKGVVPPEFTMAEFEYQVDELEFRINAITHQHGLTEKPFSYFDDSDGTYGIGDDGISSGGSEMRIFNDAKFEERIQKIEDSLYGHNPELRELVEYSQFEDDRENQLRSELELEIFRQLQLHRQDGHLKMEQHDSGRDSVSDPQEMLVDETSTSPLPSLKNSSGKIAFPKPLAPIGPLDALQNLTDDTSVKSADTRHTFIKVKPQTNSYTDDIDQLCGIFNSENDSISSQVGGKQPCNSVKTQVLPKLYSRYDSSTSGYNSDNIPKSTSKTTTQYLQKVPPEELIRDEPSNSAGSDSQKLCESFPMLNALFSSHDNLYESSSEDEITQLTSQRPKTCKEPEGRRRLRKTKTRGKGKGKRRMMVEDDGITFNDECLVSDTDNDIPTIQMYPYGTSKDCW